MVLPKVNKKCKGFLLNHPHSSLQEEEIEALKNRLKEFEQLGDISASWPHWAFEGKPKGIITLGGPKKKTRPNGFFVLGCKLGAVVKDAFTWVVFGGHV